MKPSRLRVQPYLSIGKTKKGVKYLYIKKNPLLVATGKKEFKKESGKVNQELDTLFNKLRKEKERKSRAFRQIRKDTKKISKIVSKKPTPKNQFKLIEEFATNYERALKKLNRYLDKGLISKAKYDKSLEELKQSYNKFNET
jgi:hypothetical protein